ncbi:DUF3048 domain-containing protein [Actinocorallia sp. API 0066]|uniref:DUF3048 domain-containing protein n=1 Tax=Actinocorallia sp. API 0066 TaxID=2896846 RepID=UPI001E42F2AB|nr:DUF3048 domain-containing protein [Actinocorallia sp. API 0066]MCD0448979.1 DUF3048 domain-containing protein [Actinocorallia sp. API 0066]
MRGISRRGFTVSLLGVAVAACGGKPESPAPTTPPTPTPEPTPTPTPTPTGLDYHPFTGGGKGLRNRVLAVKIDNTGPALPQLGLRSADIVYVEQVEGGQTRLMAVFCSKYPERVGPIRSARISDLHLLSQFSRPALAFSGVQGKMKPEIRAASLIDVSEDNGPRGYLRYTGRYAPYNLFGDVKALLRRAPKAGRAKDIGFRFGPAPAGGRKLKQFTARWPAATLTFRWSAPHRRWLLYRNGVPSRAAEGGIQGGRTIVIQYVKTRRSRYHDFLGAYTPYLRVTGNGRALVLRDGKAYKCTWSRPTEREGTVFTTADGERMTFARGQVWVVLVNDGKPVMP